MASNDKSQESKAFAIENLHNRYSDSNWNDGGKLFYQKVIDDRVYRLIYTNEELDQRASIKIGIDSYVKQMRYDFITGKKDIDSNWDAYIKELRGYNMDKLVEIENTAYDRMK